MKRFITHLTKVLFALLILGWSSSANAQGYSGGSGTSTDPYQVSNLADLGYLSGHSSDWSLYFIQTADIDAGATFGWDGGQGFSPIGADPSFTVNPWFDGSYDGQGHVIENLYINRPTTDNVGLFGYVPGIIKNLGLVNASVTGQDYTGALGGEVYEADNCYTTGSVTGAGNVGGLIGNVLISNQSYSACNVTGTNYVGGFTGDNLGGNTYNCYARGNVTGNTSVGGFSGTVTGVMQYCYSTGHVTGITDAGGLVGSDGGGFADNSFWDLNTSGQVSSAKGTGKTTDGMKRVGTYLSDPSLFVSWDFTLASNIWGFNASDNSGYPFLRFENYTPATLWLGTTSTDWTDVSNWSENALPSTGNKVIIPDVVNDPVLATAQTVTDLLIEQGGLLTVSTGGQLTVTTTLTNSGAASALVIDNGSMITNGTVTGQATVKRGIAGDLGWHLLSSPVTGQSILDGTFAPLAADFSTTPSTSYDFYKYQPISGGGCATSYLWQNLRNSDLSLNTTDFGATPQFDVKTGYLVAYSPDFPTTKIFAGTPNTGDQTFTLTTAPLYCPWNLLGNPYASAINWDLVTDKSNLLDGYYYVYNENKAGGPGYESYLDATHKTDGVNGKIAAMQGFFVRALGASISIPNSARTHASDSWLKSTKETPSNRISLKISNGTHYDEAYIQFESDGQAGSDWYDATKMLSFNKEIPQIYTMVEGDKKTQINSMPYITNPLTVPVGIVAPAEGTYSINVTGVENFSLLTSLTLEDVKMHHTQNLLLNPVYSFTATGNEDAGRFLLHFDGTISSTDDSNPLKIYSTEKTINVYCAAGLQNGQIIVTNMLGQQVLSQKLNDQVLNQVNMGSVSGYYIVKVQSDNAVRTSRVFIN